MPTVTSAEQGAGGERRALAAVVLLHLALVLPLAATLNIWIDEAYTLRSTSGGVAYAVRRALGFELQPPLYFVALTLWRSLSDSAFFARLFSVLCTTATVFAAAALARRYLRGVSPALVAAAVAFNPLTVYAAVEVRLYALVLFLSALVLLLLHDGYVGPRHSPAAGRRHAAAAVAALYTHYFLGFILAAGGAALLALGRGGTLRRYLGAMALTAVLFAPLAFMTVRQVRTVQTTGAGNSQTVVSGASLVWNAAWRHLLPVRPESSLAGARRWISRLAVPLLALALLARRRRPDAEAIAPLAIAAAVGVLHAGVAVTLGPDFMRPEHTVVLYLPVLLAALALLRHVGGARFAAGGILVVLLFSGPSLVTTYAPLAKPGDWVRVSRFIERGEASGEPILVFRAEYVLDFGHHYAGANELLPIPVASGDERYDPATEVLHDEGEILRVLEPALGPARRFWLVTRQTEAFRGIDVHPEILEEFVARRCVVLRSESFLASRARLLELKPEAGAGS